MSTISVTLSSPFRAEHLQQAWPGFEQVLREQVDDFTPRDPDQFIALCQSLEQQGGRSWAVLFDNVAVGCIALATVNPISGGLFVLLDQSQNAEANREAVSLALTEIFGERPYERVSSTLVSDEKEPTFRAMLLLCELGAAHEGLLRRQTLKDGAVVDVSLLGITREAFCRAGK